MSREQKVVEAANRAMDRALTETTKKALALQIDASANGRSGSGTHLKRLRNICLTGFSEVADAGKAVLLEFDRQNAGSYRDSYEKMLGRRIPEIKEVFRDHGGFSPVSGTLAEEEEADLLHTLARRCADAVDE